MTGEFVFISNEERRGSLDLRSLLSLIDIQLNMLFEEILSKEFVFLRRAKQFR